MSSAIDCPRHVRALATKSRANLKISRVSARDLRASVKFELICTVDESLIKIGGVVNYEQCAHDRSEGVWNFCFMIQIGYP